MLWRAFALTRAAVFSARAVRPCTVLNMDPGSGAGAPDCVAGIDGLASLTLISPPGSRA